MELKTPIRPTLPKIKENGRITEQIKIFIIALDEIFNLYRGLSIFFNSKNTFENPL